MNDQCPSCGLVFSREEGYFSGSMYFGYLIGLGAVLAIAGVLYLTIARGWSATGVFALAALLFAPCIPATFRYARIVWIHLDRALEP